MSINKKRWALFSVLLSIIIFYVYFCIQKYGLFIDEIYTYGLSNSHFAPFVRNLKTNNTIVDTIFYKKDFFAYLTVNNNKFDFASVYYNQTQDVHPPLYYWLINIVSSFVPGVFSKWIGLSLNGLIYLSTTYLIYKICYKLYKSSYIALIATALYGFSQIAISTALMIRMYILSTLLTTLLVFIIVVLEDNYRNYKVALVSIIIFLGLMTHYYFVIYAFFISLFYCFYLIVAKRIKHLILYSTSALIGVISMALAYPSVFTHMGADKLVSGKSAIKSMSNVLAMFSKLYYYSKHTAIGLLISLLVALITLTIVLFNHKLLYKTDLKHNKLPIIIIVPAFLTLFVISIISPVNAMRYMYNIAPIFIITVGWIIYIYSQIEKIKKTNAKTKANFVLKKVSLSMIVVFSIILTLIIKPNYIYKDYIDLDTVLDEYKHSPCIYFDNDYNAPITQDMLQLMIFDSVFVANDTTSKKLQKYLEQSNDNSLVIYIDVDEFWSSGYDSRKILDEFIKNHPDYKLSKKLFNVGLSETYLLNKEEY